MNLDSDLVSNIRINLSAIERRTSTLTKRRSVKKEYQAAWLLKAISLIDLTTLSGDDTAGKVERLCEKAKRPISLDLLEQLGLQQGDIQVGAVCVYHHLIKEAKKNLPKNIPVAAVSTGFPAGLSSFKTRKLEITESIKTVLRKLILLLIGVLFCRIIGKNYIKKLVILKKQQKINILKLS